MLMAPSNGQNFTVGGDVDGFSGSMSAQSNISLRHRIVEAQSSATVLYIDN